MLLRIHPDNPNQREIDKVIKCLKSGGVIIYPTDTVYAFGCDINSTKAIDRICQIKNIQPKKALFSFICYDLKHLADYAKQIPNNVFKFMKSALPGPYTFILNAHSSIPKQFRSKRKTVGIRVPDNNVAREIVRQLGNPLLSSSIKDGDIEYVTDPPLIYEKYKDKVDIVIDGGYGNFLTSTVLDCTSDEIEIVRQGAGEF